MNLVMNLVAFNNPQLKSGWVLAQHLDRIGNNTITKWQAMYYLQKAKYDELAERYRNRLKVSAKHIKQTLRSLGKSLEKVMDVKNIGIVTSPAISFSAASFKYEIKKHCEAQGLTEWRDNRR
eukprot:766359_1